MKDIEELENMTWWDITTNEGVLTQFILGVAMILLGFLYLTLDIYYCLRFWR